MTRITQMFNSLVERTGTSKGIAVALEEVEQQAKTKLFHSIKDIKKFMSDMKTLNLKKLAPLEKDTVQLDPPMLRRIPNGQIKLPE